MQSRLLGIACTLGFICLPITKITVARYFLHRSLVSPLKLIKSVKIVAQSDEGSLSEDSPLLMTLDTSILFKIELM